MLNPCIRCGKQRIISSTKTTNIGQSQSILVYTKTVCPDSDCQAIVDEIFAEQKRKKDLLMSKKEEAKAERAKLVANTKAMLKI